MCHSSAQFKTLRTTHKRPLYILQQCSTMYCRNMILSHGRVTTDRVWIGNWNYWTLTHNSWLHYHMHTPMSTVMFSVLLLGRSFQWWTFPFLWVPEISSPQLPASNSNSSQRLNHSSSLTITSQSHVMTDSQLASVPWCQAPIWC
jgi:hypothetical protein